MYLFCVLFAPHFFVKLLKNTYRMSLLKSLFLFEFLYAAILLYFFVVAGQKIHSFKDSDLKNNMTIL